MRLADEALRYQRIKIYLFEKNKYLSFSETQFQINENEILIPESMITNEYFEGMKAFKRNKYIHFNTYDTSQPVLSVAYSENVTLDECVVRTQSFVSKFLQTLYPADYKSMEFGRAKRVERTPMCSFDLITTILNNEGIKKTKQCLNYRVNYITVVSLYLLRTRSLLNGCSSVKNYKGILYFGNLGGTS